jgi:hypothetical protein
MGIAHFIGEFGHKNWIICQQIFSGFYWRGAEVNTSLDREIMKVSVLF